MICKRNTSLCILQVLGMPISVIKIKGEFYISLTDIARVKNPWEPKSTIQNRMRGKYVLAFLGVWEQLNNPDFKDTEFDAFKKVN